MRVSRAQIMNDIQAALARSRIVLLVGPRQCGKTTLARELLNEESVNYFDLEDPASLARLDEPMTALQPLRGLVVIDEIQRRPELFPTLRVLADRRSLPARFLIRQLQPWHANLRKRQVKSPKVYVRDSGLLHFLLGIESAKGLLTHPKMGASWEGFVIEQVLATQRLDEAYFWATHQGAEMDLLLRRGDRMLGVECKRADAPRMTPSIRIALEDLRLQHVVVIYPGTKRYPIHDRVEAVPLASIAAGEKLFAEST